MFKMIHRPIAQSRVKQESLNTDNAYSFTCLENEIAGLLEFKLQLWVYLYSQIEKKRRYKSNYKGTEIQCKQYITEK
jgi:hypothetical protein